MKKRLRIVIALVVIIAIVLGFIHFATREPMYRGRPLRNWIHEGFAGQHRNPAAAREAVLACGTNAIPFYLKLLQTRPDSRLTDKVLDLLQKHHWPSLGLTRQNDDTSDADIGMEGLCILGPQARSAAPTLVKILGEKDRDQAVQAGYALAHIGEGRVRN